LLAVGTTPAAGAVPRREHGHHGGGLGDRAAVESDEEGLSWGTVYRAGRRRVDGVLDVVDDYQAGVGGHGQPQVVLHYGAGNLDIDPVLPVRADNSEDMPLRPEPAGVGED